MNGGAELLCRWIAEHMSKHYDVEVITTCAIDYITWKNEYKSGKDVVNGITVFRFPVDKPRNMQEFNTFFKKILENKHSARDELKWMKLQGPYSSKLLNFIKNNKNKYDFFIFFTYLYCTTFFGMPLVKDKAILVPTAHDEPPIYLSIFNSLFKLPKAIIYSTEEEKRFVNSKFQNQNIPDEIIGVGIDVPEKIYADDFKKKFNVNNFLIYVGRIDESKGCKELFEYFMKYKEEEQLDIKLVLIGKPVMEIPIHQDIIQLGFVSEQDKFNAIKAARLLIMPSKYESLSMVIMEAWLSNTAVLVNGNCEVLKGHSVKSNGGLYYKDYEEFKECLHLLLKNSRLRERLGENGMRYVKENYRWNVVERKYLRLLEGLKK